MTWYDNDDWYWYDKMIDIANERKTHYLRFVCRYMSYHLWTSSSAMCVLWMSTCELHVNYMSLSVHWKSDYDRRKYDSVNGRNGNLVHGPSTYLLNAGQLYMIHIACTHPSGFCYPSGFCLAYGLLLNLRVSVLRYKGILNCYLCYQKWIKYLRSVYMTVMCESDTYLFKM